MWLCWESACQMSRKPCVLSPTAHKVDVVGCACARALRGGGLWMRLEVRLPWGPDGVGDQSGAQGLMHVN